MNESRSHSGYLLAGSSRPSGATFDEEIDDRLDLDLVLDLLEPIDQLGVRERLGRIGEKSESHRIGAERAFWPHQRGESGSRRSLEQACVGAASSASG